MSNAARRFETTYEQGIYAAVSLESMIDRCRAHMLKQEDETWRLVDLHIDHTFVPATSTSVSAWWSMICVGVFERVGI